MEDIDLSSSEDVGGGEIEAICQHAAQLGIDPLEHPDLLWIAEEAILASLPQPWIKAIDEASGVEYYYNEETQESTWTNPTDEYYRSVAARYLTKGEAVTGYNGAAIGPIDMLKNNETDITDPGCTTTWDVENKDIENHLLQEEKILDAGELEQLDGRKLNNSEEYVSETPPRDRSERAWRKLTKQVEQLHTAYQEKKLEADKNEARLRRALKKAVSTMRKERKGWEQDKEHLNCQVKELQDTMLVIDKSSSGIQSKSNSMKELKLVDRLAAIQQHVSELVKERDDWHTMLEEERDKASLLVKGLSDELDGSQSQLSEANSKIVQLREQLDREMKQSCGSNEDVQRLTQEVQKLQVKLKTTENYLLTTEENLFGKTMELESCAVLLKGATCEPPHTHDSETKGILNIETKETQFTTTTHGLLHTMAKEALDDLNQVESGITYLDRIVLGLQATHTHNMAVSAAKANDASGQHHETAAQYIELKEKYDLQSEQLADVRKLLYVSHEQHSELQRENDCLQVQSNAASQTLHETQEQFVSLQERYDQQSQTVSDLSNRLQESQESYVKLKEQYTAVQSELSATSPILHETQEQFVSLQERYDRQSQTVSELNKRLQESQESYVKLKEQYTAVQSELSATSPILHDTQEQFGSLQERYDRQSQTVSELNKRLQESQESYVKLKEQYTSVQSEFSATSALLNEFQGQFGSLQERYDQQLQIVTDLNKLLRESQDNCTSINEQNAALQLEVSSATCQRLHVPKIHNKELRDKFNELRSARAGTGITAIVQESNETQVLDSNHESTIARLQVAERALHQSKLREKNLKDQVAELRTVKEQLLVSISHQVSARDGFFSPTNASEQINEMRKILVNLTKENYSLMAQFEKANESIEHLETENDRLLSRCNYLRDGNSKLLQQNQQVWESVEQTDQVARLQVDRLTRLIRKLQHSNEMLSSDCI